MQHRTALAPELLFRLTEEEALFQQELRNRFSEDPVFQDIIGRARESTAFDRDLYHEAFQYFQRCGLTGYGIPETYGGWPGTSRGSILAAEETCRHDPSIGLSQGATTSLVATPIMLFGTEEQKQTWLPKIAKGEVIGCYCQTEPDAGSDVASLKAEAVFRDGRWRISGEKAFITNGSEAHLGLVVARIGPDRYRGLAVFIVDLERAKLTGELTILRNEKKPGLHLSPTTAMRFDDCCADGPLGAIRELPDGTRTGEGWKVLNATLVGSRATVIAAQGRAVALGAFDVARSYADMRTQFFLRITDMPQQRARILRVEAALEMGRLLSWQAALLRDTLGREDSRPWQLEASLAKLWNGELAEWGPSEMLQLCGGVGYTDARIFKFWQDGRIVKIYEGTSDVQCLIIAREMLLSCLSRDPATVSEELLVEAANTFPPDPARATLPSVYFPIAHALAAEEGNRLVREEHLFRKRCGETLTGRDEAIAAMASLLAREKIFAARETLRHTRRSKPLRELVEGNP